MNKQEIKKRRQDIIDRQQLEGMESNLNRARSITVGTSFGGTTEIMVRGEGSKFMWCAMQPVEVAELIHQLASNIGCHVALKPREDFASWREWRVSEAEKKHLNSFPPFPNDMAMFQQVGISGVDEKKAEEEINFWLKQTEYEYDENGGARIKNQKKELVENDENAMAAQKALNKRVPKRVTRAPK